MEISRRDLFRGGRDAGSVLAISRLLRELGLPPVADARAAEAGLSAGADVYQSIGVRPLINARGTFTIISGSLMLPEVRAAMEEAAKHYGEQHVDALSFTFSGKVAGNEVAGTLDMGEYLAATWRAKRSSV